MEPKMILDELCKTLNSRKESATLTEDGLRYLFFFHMVEKLRQPNLSLDDILNIFILEAPYNKLSSLSKENVTYEDSALKGEKGTSKHELDLLYKDGNYYIAIEIKFDRETKKGSPKTSKAGNIFNDLKRLQIIKGKNVKKYFIYLTDDEMYEYLTSKNKSRGITNSFLNAKFKSMFSAKTGEMISISSENKGNIPGTRDRALTFLKSATKSFAASYRDKYFNKDDFNFTFFDMELKMLFRKTFDMYFEDNKNKTEMHLFAFEVMNK